MQMKNFKFSNPLAFDWFENLTLKFVFFLSILKSNNEFTAYIQIQTFS